MPGVDVRFYRLEDAESLLEAARESVAEVGAWLPWCHAELSLREVRDWLARQVEARQEGTAFEFAIIDGDGRYLGGLGINSVSKEHRFANLGYWVRSSSAGRGVATAAVRAAIHWAFEHTELERLEIVCAVENRRSRRVAQRVGARREGVLRSRLVFQGRSHDAVIYSVVRSDLVRGLGS